MSLKTVAFSSRGKEEKRKNEKEEKRKRGKMKNRKRGKEKKRKRQLIVIVNCGNR